jgi:hypothetical protein
MKQSEKKPNRAKAYKWDKITRQRKQETEKKDNGSQDGQI